MAGRVSRSLVLSQLSFFSLLAICLAIEPHFLVERDEGGVSNFGVTAATTLPYSLAFLLCGALLVAAGSQVPARPVVLDHFRRALVTLGILNVVVLASTYPYKIDATLRDIHIGAGALLLAFELAVSCWLAVQVPTRWSVRSLVVVQAAGCLIALITLLGVVHLLFIGQILAAAAFGVLLVRTGGLLLDGLPVKG